MGYFLSRKITRIYRVGSTNGLWNKSAFDIRVKQVQKPLWSRGRKLKIYNFIIRPSFIYKDIELISRTFLFAHGEKNKEIMASVSDSAI